MVAEACVSWSSPHKSEGYGEYLHRKYRRGHPHSGTEPPSRARLSGGTNDWRFAAALGLLRRFEEPLSLEREIRARQ